MASWAERALFLFLWRFWKSWESRLFFPLSDCLLPTGPLAARDREWWCVIVQGFYRIGRSSHRIYSIPDQVHIVFLSISSSPSHQPFNTSFSILRS